MTELSFEQAIEASKQMVGQVPVNASSLVPAAHKIKLGHRHISFGDVSEDQMILAANQNSDLNDYYYYP